MIGCIRSNKNPNRSDPKLNNIDWDIWLLNTVVAFSIGLNYDSLGLAGFTTSR